MSIKLDLKDCPARIPNVDRNDLPQLFKDMGFKVGAEIGVDRGIYIEKLLKAGLKIYGIDPWLYYEDYPHPQGQKRLDFLYKHTQRVVAPYDCELIRKTSMEAVKDFEDNSLDFVYIDGHHGFKYIAEDLWEWTKKVKKGGIIAGHDYAKNKHNKIRDPFVLDVAPVIDAWIKARGIKNWYLLGEDKAPEGDKRDTFRSWLWIKE